MSTTAQKMQNEKKMDELAGMLATMSQNGVQLGPHLRTMLAGRGANVAPPEVDECWHIAEKHRIEGNALFDAGEDQKAANAYENGIGILRQFDECKDSRITKLHVALHLNCAMANFRMEKWRECAAFCSPVIALQPEGDPGIARGLTIEGLVKAMYRRGVSYSKTHQWKLAEQDLGGCMRTGSRTFAEPARRELLRMHARWDAERAAENKRTGFGGALAHAKGGVYTDIDVARREKWIEKHRADALMERAFHENNKKRIKDGKLEIEFEEWNKARTDKRVATRERVERKKEKASAAAEAARREERLAAGVERVVVDDEEGLEKGYRKTETGAETPYFTPVVAEAAAAPVAAEIAASLERAAAPAQLVAPPAVAAPRVSTLPSDQTKWCVSSFEAHLKEAAFTQTVDGITVAIKAEASRAMGDAAIQVLAGVRRYVFDLAASLAWEAEIRRDGDKFSVFSRGSVDLPEVASTCQGLYNVDLKEKRPCKKPEHAAALKAALGGFEADVLARVGAFEAEYRSRNRVPDGVWDLQWAGGVLEVELREGGCFFCGAFPDRATWVLDGDNLSIDWGKHGSFELREELLGAWVGGRVGDAKEDWRKLFFRRTRTPAEKLTSGSAWNLHFKNGRPFRVELRADGSFYAADYPGNHTWALVDGRVRIDWGRYGSYALKIDAKRRVLKGDKVGDPGNWRRLEFIEALAPADPQE